MKSKNYINKIYYVLSIGLLIGAGALFPSKALGSDNLVTSDDEDVRTSASKILYASNAYFTVTIPKQIVLDGTTKQSNYSVKVSGDIASNQIVVVSATDEVSDADGINFYMKDMSNVEFAEKKKSDVLTTVTHTKTDWNFVDAQNSVISNDNVVSAPNLTAGSWQGTLNFKISMALNLGNRVACGNDLLVYGGTKDADYSYDEASSVLTIKSSEKLTIQSLSASGANLQNINITASNANLVLYGDWIIPSEAEVTVSNGTKLTMANGSRLILMEGYTENWTETTLTIDAGGQAITADGQGTGITLEGNAKIIINRNAEMLLYDAAYLWIKDINGQLDMRARGAIYGIGRIVYTPSINETIIGGSRGIEIQSLGEGGSPFSKP